MANNNGWITKPILLGALCTVLFVGGTANYIWDYSRDCKASDARAKICDDHRKEMKEFGDKIDTNKTEVLEKVEGLRKEIKKDMKDERKERNEHMKEIKELIRANGTH